MVLKRSGYHDNDDVLNKVEKYFERLVLGQNDFHLNKFVTQDLSQFMISAKRHFRMLLLIVHV